MYGDFSLKELKDEISALTEGSAYARMLIAQVLADESNADELSGFYIAEREYECKQRVRWLVRDGKPCDITEKAPARDLALISDASKVGDRVFIFIRK